MSLPHPAHGGRNSLNRMGGKLFMYKIVEERYHV